MTNQTKRGFSLVEVMILFTVLAVIMAATLPVITKKSRPVPTKVPHGVYRCIANGDGQTYTVETYNSFRLLNRNDSAPGCQFDVPKSANIYKIDLYSAGAGGTKYAAYKPVQDDNRNGYFGMKDAVQYAKSDGSKLPFVMASSLPANRKDMPYTLDNTDLLWAFGGGSYAKASLLNRQIIMTAYTADAGKGGDSQFSYNTPARSICTAVESGEGVYSKNESDALSKYNTATENLNKIIKKYDDLEAALEAKANGFQTGVDYNSGLLESIPDHQKALNDYIDKMKQLNADINSFKNTSKTKEERVDLYDNHIKNVADTSLADEGVAAANTFVAGPVYYTKANGSQGVFSVSYPYNYNNVSSRASSMKSKISTVDAWVNNNANHTKYYYDDKGNVVYSEVKSYQEKVNDLFELLVDPTKSGGVKTDFNTYQGYAQKMYEDTTTTTTIVSIQKELTKLESTLTHANESLQEQIDFIKEGPASEEGTLNYLYAQRNTAENIPGKDLYEAKKAKEKAKAEYDTAVAHHQEFNQNANVDHKFRPSQYNDKTELMFDTDYHYTKAQIEDFCKATYKDYYDAKEANNETVAIFETKGGQASVLQRGGNQGKGTYLRLIYTLYFDSSDKSKYPDEDAVAAGATENKKFAKYPYAKFIGDLYGNINGRGYAVASCTNVGWGAVPDSTTCTVNDTISSASSGQSISTSDYSKLDIVDNKHYLRNDELDTDAKAKGEGKDVGKYLAFHVPDFVAHDTVGKFDTIQQTYAKGGKKAAVGYTESDATYDGTNQSTNLAWDVFKGEGETAGQDYAKAGIDVLLQNPDEGKSVAKRYSIKKADSKLFQEPELNMEAQLWTKHYYVGSSGGHGNKVHVQTTSMGSRCTISIPHGGPTLDYFKLQKEANDQGLNPNNYIVTKKLEYENKLHAEITCQDDDDIVVLHKIAKGGEYNLDKSSSFSSSVFYWSKNKSYHLVKNDSQDYVSGYSGVGSRWAKIFFSVMTNGHHTIEPLSTYGVANGGGYTSVYDYCTAVKGGMRLRVNKLTSTESQSSVSFSEQLEDTQTGMTYNGMKGDVDCYKDDNGQYEGLFTMNAYDTNKSSLVYDPSVTGGYSGYKYVIDSPSEAGGGAIVITW